MGYWNILSNCPLYTKSLEVMNNIRTSIDEIKYWSVNTGNNCCHHNRLQNLVFEPLFIHIVKSLHFKRRKFAALCCGKGPFYRRVGRYKSNSLRALELSQLGYSVTSDNTGQQQSWPGYLDTLVGIFLLYCLAP